jgi:hypothetical protein
VSRALYDGADSPVSADDKVDEAAGDSHKGHDMDGCGGLAKVRVAGSNPVVRSKALLRGHFPIRERRRSQTADPW